MICDAFGHWLDFFSSGLKYVFAAFEGFEVLLKDLSQCFWALRG